MRQNQPTKQTTTAKQQQKSFVWHRNSLGWYDSGEKAKSDLGTSQHFSL